MKGVKLKSDIPLGDTPCSALFFELVRVVRSRMRSGGFGNLALFPFFIRAHVVAGIVRVAKPAIPACAAFAILVPYYMQIVSIVNI